MKDGRDLQFKGLAFGGIVDVFDRIVGEADEGPAVDIVVRVIVEGPAHQLFIGNPVLFKAWVVAIVAGGLEDIVKEFLLGQIARLGKRQVA